MPAEGGVPQAADLHRHARPRRRLRPHGAEQHRHGLEARRQDDRLPLAHAIDSTTFIGQLFTVSIDGGLPQQLPLPRGGFCSFSPDGTKLAYNRVFREFRTWKRYRGGMADDVWIYDFDTKKTEQLTNNAAQDIIPMWHGDKIYFLSDRDESKRMNLYVYDLDDQRDAAADALHGLRHQVPVARRQGHRLRDTAAGSIASTWRREKVGQGAVRILRIRRPGRGGLTRREQEHRGLRDRPGRQAGRVRRPRRPVHRPGQGRPDAQPDEQPRQSTTAIPTGRPTASRSPHLRCHRRGRNLRRSRRTGKGRRSRSPPAATAYKYAIAWSPDSKKILWADKKHAAAVTSMSARSRSSRSSSRRSGKSAITSGRRTAMDRLRPAGSGRA